jgi:hypothetical protein
MLNCPGPELEFVNFLRSPGIDSQLGARTTTLFDVPARQATKAGEIDSMAPETFTNSGSRAGSIPSLADLYDNPI